jgi:ATP-dependent protease HslVU (ClpYQ) peptidase subunit
MTTIATDGKVVASDSRMSGAYIDQSGAQKLWRVGASIVACAGDYAMAIKFVEWANAGYAPDAKPDISENFEAIVVTKAAIKYYCPHLVGVRVGRPAAIGTGVHYAMGAMLAGASPKRAVEIAKRLDSGTGGKVVTMEVPR